MMRKMRRFLYLLLLMTIIIRCSDGSYQRQLSDIGELLRQHKNEEASDLLEQINPEALDDEKTISLYWFYKMQADYRLGREIRNVEPLKQAIKYFEKHKEKEKLTWTYYYLGTISDDLNDRANAIMYLKKGETIASEINRDDLLHHIDQVITGINHDAKEYDLAVAYGRRTLNLAIKLNDSLDIAADLMNLAVSYSEMGVVDSGSYYIDRMIPYLQAVPKKKRSNYYSNIGILYKKLGNELAKVYLNKSIDIDAHPYSCKALAQIYAKEGNREKAFEMWHKALNTTSLSLKANVVKDMAKAKKEEGDYKAAHELSLWSAALKDSLHRQQKEENIKGQQELFDKERANEQLREERGHAIWMVAILALLIAALAAWTIYKKRKNSHRMNALNEELEQKDSAIEQLQQENEQKGKELERLSRDMTGYEEKHEKLLAAGQRLYEEIVAGGNTLEWEKEDFVHFVRYYKLKHADFVRHLENDYDELTARQKVFMILYDMGMTDEDVMRTLVLTESSVRANKTRIKGKKLSSDKSEEETVN